MLPPRSCNQRWRTSSLGNRGDEHDIAGTTLRRPEPVAVLEAQALLADCGARGTGHSHQGHSTADASGARRPVVYAKSMRSHGLPGFPDPNGRDAFDRSKFDDRTPALQSAGKACQSSRQAVGAVPVG
jgi:hypothetical protein